MKQISALLRIVCGLAILILAYTTHSRNSQQIAAGDPVLIFGHATSASSSQLMLGFGVIGLLGLYLIVFGVVTLLKNRS